MFHIDQASEVINGRNLSFSNNEEFNQIAKALIGRPEHSSTQSALFASKLSEIKNKTKNSFSTPWGGVALQKVEEPLVEKFLVVHGGNFLAFEKHEKKEEWLTLVEGEALLMHKKAGSDVVTLITMQPGIEIFIAPGEEHCLLAKENSVVFEHGFDYKGMDQDLIFIYLPE